MPTGNISKMPQLWIVNPDGTKIILGDVQTVNMNSQLNMWQMQKHYTSCFTVGFLLITGLGCMDIELKEKKGEVKMGKRGRGAEPMDLTGQRFGRLTVIERDREAEK